MKQAQITLQTAKALYAQGGAARQLALDNFPKLALNEPNWPKSWRELDRINGFFNFADATIFNAKNCKADEGNKTVAPTEADCESILAFCQLRQLSERMNMGWEPSERNRGYTVNSFFDIGLQSTSAADSYKELIVFKTIQMAEFSRQHHKSLWKKYLKV